MSLRKPTLAPGGPKVYPEFPLRAALAWPAGPAASSQPALSIGGAPPSPLLFPCEVSLLAQPHLEEDQEQRCAEAERYQRDGQQIARRPADQGGADRAGDD